MTLLLAWRVWVSEFREERIASVVDLRFFVKGSFLGVEAKLLEARVFN